MDLRQLLNVAYAYLTRPAPDGRELPADKVAQIDADLAAKFEHEMTDREKKTLEYRRKAAELGIDLSAQREIMDAFKMAPATAGRR